MTNRDNSVVNGVRGSAEGSGNGSVGFVAGKSVSNSVLPLAGLGKRYQAVGSDDEGRVDTAGRSAKVSGGEPEPFEVELLSDVEGVDATGHVDMRGRDCSDGDDECGFHEEDRWMGNIWSQPNRAVVMSYFCVGFAMRFLGTPLSYYLVQIGAEAGSQNVVRIMAQLPWSFKLIFGFISDNFPLCGMRRKPYFIMGWAVYALVNLYVAANPEPGVLLVAGAMLASTIGFMFSDVTTDAILVERSKREPRERRGSMQAVGYSVRFAGSVFGSVLGMTAYNDESWGFGWSIQSCFFLNAVFPIFIIGPWVWHLQETNTVTSANRAVMNRIKAQSTEVFKALEQKAVFGPLSVVFVYNLMQVPNVAWNSFLVEGLDFKEFELGIIGIVGSVMASCGLLAYKQWFFHTSWRKIYIWATLTVMFFSLLQLLLIFRVNKMLGIPDLLFAVGDESIQDFVVSIQFLPIVQMYLSMCPDGAEGTTYAILTTMSNVAGGASMTIGTAFTKIWDVTNKTLATGDFSGMWKYTLLTCLIQPIPLLLIRRLPANQAEQRALQNCGIRDPRGGVALLVVLFSSLSITIRQSLVELSTN